MTICVPELSETGIGDNEPDVSEPSVTSTFVTEADARFSFLALQNDLCSCRTFKDLVKLASNSKALIPMSSFSLPPYVQETVFDVGIVYKTALGLRPAGLENLFPLPVLTGPDGNCAPGSLSLLCFGDQNHHIELVTNQFDNLC